MILEIHPDHPQNRLINRVVEVLRQDGVIVYPSDTSYGLGCSIFSKKLWIASIGLSSMERLKVKHRL